MDKLNSDINELRELKKSINNLKRTYININDNTGKFKENIKEVIDLLSRTYEEVFNNVSHVGKIKNYGDIYLPMIIKLLDKYNTLKKKNVNTTATQAFYSKIENLSETLVKHFKEKYNSIFDDDIVINDAELKALLTSIK